MEQVQQEDQIKAIAQEVRAFLEPKFPRKTEADGSQVVDSAGSCFRAAHLLAHVLNERLGDNVWIAGEGIFASPEVLALMEAGELRTWSAIEDVGQFHGWVIDEKATTIVDITSDQFGLPPVLVMNIKSVEANGWLHRYFPDRSVRESDIVWIGDWKAHHERRDLS